MSLALRAVALYVPVLATAALAIRRWPDSRRLTAALLAGVWNVPALLAVNMVAEHVGWWRFTVEDGTAAGVPVDLWLGWALLWGAIPVLVTVDRWPLTVAVLVAFDLVAMPLLGPVTDLGDAWLVGEALAVAVGLVPGLLLGRWTARAEHVVGRARLQAVGFSALALYVVPSIVFAVTGEGWRPLFDRPLWQLAVGALVAAPAGLATLAAVHVFAVHGRGTPVPMDPPTRLVTTGPYAYVANPMQLGATVVLLVEGILLASPAVVAAAVAAAAFSAGIAAWIEHHELTARFGDDWRTYRHHVRLWLPRLRPYTSAARLDAAGGPV
jgi:protein-S-isoprenylcysteine O-methyltransferase Ste14